MNRKVDSSSVASSSEAPMSAKQPRGDIAVANVQSLTHDARGVARIEGKTTFIEGALPGEEVKFRYHNKRPRYDLGTVLEVLSASPDRVAPPCPHYGVCGGCSLQHLAPSAQVLAKQQILVETLSHLGRVEPATWLPPIQASTNGYRRRARLGVRLVPQKGGVLVGFRERRRSYITPLSDCVTLDVRFAKLLPALRDLIAGLSQPNRLPQIEIAAGDDACAAVFRHLEPLTAADRERLVDFAKTSGIAVHLQPEGPESIAPLWPAVPPILSYRLPAFDVELVFEPTDFIQVNGAVNQALIERAVTLLEVDSRDTVLDLFCGLGNFTLPLARRTAKVVGVEAEPGLVARARANAERNGLTNAEFRIENLYAEGVQDLIAAVRPNKLLLDPPRAGAVEIIKTIPKEQGPTRIVYVSCNPATLARDSEYLVHVLGYRLEAAGVADMFPHTSHVESIALFVRP